MYIYFIRVFIKHLISVSNKICQHIRSSGSIRQRILLLILFVISQFWRGTLGEARDEFSTRLPKGEITALIEGKAPSVAEGPSESQLESQLGDLIGKGHSLSMVIFDQSFLSCK